MSRLLKSFFVVAAVAVLLASPSIHAQIKNIYDSSEENLSGITSLMSAVASNDVNGVRFFSKAGGALINQKNLGGATALHLACREGNVEIAKILIDYGADVNLVDNEGWTPLMRAALLGNRNIIDLLLMKGAQAAALNSVGESAIFHAASSDCNECLSLMFEKYNFAKFMELEALKIQLADGFVVARNHNNEVAQDMITAYLNRLSQIAPMFNSGKTGGASTVGQGKKFVFKTDDKTTSIVEVESTPILADPMPIANKPSGEFTQRELNSFGKKFKFVVGEQGKSGSKKDKNKIGVTKPQAEKSEATVVLEEKTVEIAKSIPTEGFVYKLNAGPAGKLIKRKAIKKKEVVVHPVITPKAAAVPVVNAPAAGATSKIINSVPINDPVDPVSVVPAAK